MFKNNILLSLLLVLSLISSAAAEEREGDYLYGVTTLRAAPGELAALLDWIAEWKATDFHESSGSPEPFVMRHSQGDQWDLMVITPFGSWAEQYTEEATAAREAATRSHAEHFAALPALVAFQEDHFAYGPPLAALEAAWEDNDFFHVEMFFALPGLAADLLEQRRMENEYLEATGQVTNMIFRRGAGSDVDVFTIGFHRSLETFAAPSPATDDEKEDAARDAGFDGRADISFYLRSLISGHHDTLAVKVD